MFLLFCLGTACLVHSTSVPVVFHQLCHVGTTYSPPLDKEGTSKLSHFIVEAVTIVCFGLYCASHFTVPNKWCVFIFSLHLLASCFRICLQLPLALPLSFSFYCQLWTSNMIFWRGGGGDKGIACQTTCFCVCYFAAAPLSPKKRL